MIQPAPAPVMMSSYQPQPPPVYHQQHQYTVPMYQGGGEGYRQAADPIEAERSWMKVPISLHSNTHANSLLMTIDDVIGGCIHINDHLNIIYSSYLNSLLVCGDHMGLVWSSIFLSLGNMVVGG